MGKRGRNQFTESLVDNGYSYQYYIDRLKELAVSTFDWDGLPDTVDERFLESTLFQSGFALFFKDDVIGHLALKCTLTGPLNVYGIATKRRAYAANGYNAQFDQNSSVIIWNNNLHKPSWPTVNYYAKRLWELDRIIDVNCRVQKTPALLQGTEQQKLMLQNLYMQFDGNQPYIMADKSLDLGSAIKSIQTGAPYVADRLYDLKTQLWNEALTALGISNVAFQKRERMNTDEVARGMGGTIASRFGRLAARQQAAEEINRMFGLDISVHFRDADTYDDDQAELLPGSERMAERNDEEVPEDE